MWTLVILTAVLGGKLPQVQVLHGEVDKGGQLAGSPSLREALQVFAGQESQGGTTATHPHINTSGPAQCLEKTTGAPESPKPDFLTFGNYHQTCMSAWVLH